MSIKFENNAKSTLSAAISNSSTSLSVSASDGSKFPEIVSPNYAYATLDDGTNKEVVKITAHTAGAASFTVVRAQDSIAGATTAYSFAAGTKFEMRPCAALFESILAEALAAASELALTVIEETTGTLAISSATARGATHNLTYATAGTSISTSEAASAFGNGYFFLINNRSSKKATFDPYLSEQIDGGSSIDIIPGERRLIVCDGTNWYSAAVSRPDGYKLRATHYYTYDGTNILLDGVSQANGANSISYAKPEWLRALRVRAVGGGGGGGGGNSNASETSCGGGGAAGGYAEKWVLASLLGATETITIGAKGAGVTGLAGTTGGDTTFTVTSGSTVTANGGAQGSAGTSGTSTAPNGASAQGGSASNGDLNVPGSNSEFGFRYGATSGLSGRGGDSMFGSGARGVAASSSTAGNNAAGYGAGGSGAVDINNTPAGGTAGGDGTAGILILEEYE